MVRKRPGDGKRKKIFLWLCRSGLLVTLLAFLGCATESASKQPLEDTGPATIEAISATPSGKDVTMVEISMSKSAPYTAFKLAGPSRIITDIRGVPGSELAPIIPVNKGSVTSIRFEKGMTQALTTRVVIDLSGPADYKVADRDRTIAVMITSKTSGGQEVAIQGEMSAAPIDEPKAEDAQKGTASDARIFFEPRNTPFNEILGIDFTMMDQGKSQFTITSDKRIPYQLNRKDTNILLLSLENTTIRPLLLRHLDSTHFEGAMDSVLSEYSSDEKRLKLIMHLREMVPYHVDQTDQSIQIDFGRTSIEPPDMKIVPLQVSETKTVVIQPAAEPEVKKPTVPMLKEEKSAQTVMVAAPSASSAPGPGIPGMEKVYRGRPMTMDFVNAEVTNVLRLIGEVSELNIVWGPEVKGNVSMRLKSVPWDQALDLVMMNNDLAMRKQGNVIWVATRQHMGEVEDEERKKREDAEKEEENKRKKKLEALKASEEIEPLKTAYFPLDFAKAEEMKDHIVTSKRGNVSVNDRTNTIIVYDIASVIKGAEALVKRFDSPVKQIMIEARIVDAATTLGRDLGVRWGSLDGTTPGIDRRWRYDTDTDWDTEITDFSNDRDLIVGGSFSTNSPEDWVANIGLSLARLTNYGQGLLGLDASLALAESEGEAKIISAPKVIASNGEKAIISRGDTFYLAAAENVEPKEVNADLSLEVTPTVSYNNFVTMEVIVKDEAVRGEAAKTGKEIETILMVKSGETVVIGGIYKEDISTEETGIPVVKDIPVVGWLTKAQRRIKQKSELLIFISPTVLPVYTKR